MKPIGLILLFLFASQLKAQQLPDDVKRTIESYLETIETSADYTQILEELTSFLQKPVKINQAGIDELINFPLITPVDAANIIRHRNRYGLLLDINEFQVIGFSIEKIKAIQPFISLDISSKDKFRNLGHELKNGQTEVVSTFKYNPSSRNPDFTGDPLGSSIRAKYHAPGKFSIGLTADKDAGEQWWNKGPDFYSFHASVYNLGRFKIITLGDYLMSVGQGLVLGSGIGIGKSAAVLNIKRSQPMVKPYRGINEYLFLRGAATTLLLGKAELTIAGSVNGIDARLTDSLSAAEFAFTSIDLDGFHRSAQEIEQKRNSNRHMAGSWLNFNGKRGNAGFGWTNMGTSAIPAADNKLYRLFYPKTQFQNFIHAWQGHTIGALHLFSEAVYLLETQKHAISAGALISLGRGVEMSAHYRNYAPGFNSPYSTAFGNIANNETGFYTGIKVQISKKLSLSQYTDFFNQPWVTFRIYSPSKNRESLWQLDFNPTRKSQIYLRLRNINRAINQTDGNLRTTGEYNIRTLRIHFTAPVSMTDKLEFRGEHSVFSNSSSEHSSLFYGEYSGKSNKLKLNIIARYSLFNISGYYNRIYAYENQLLYDFGIIAFYGRGRSAYILMQKNIGKQLKVGLRYAWSESSSGGEQATRNQRIFIQLVWKPKSQ